MNPILVIKNLNNLYASYEQAIDTGGSHEAAKFRTMIVDILLEASSRCEVIEIQSLNDFYKLLDSPKPENFLFRKRKAASFKDWEALAKIRDEEHSWIVVVK